MGTHPIFESDFDCLTETKKKMVKVKEIVPTDTFRLIAKKLGKNDLEDLIKYDEEEIEDEVNALDVSDDQAFEFMDIFDKCKEHIADGYEIQFTPSKAHGVIEKDEIQAPAMASEPILPGRISGPRLGMPPMDKLELHNIEPSQK